MADSEDLKLLRSGELDLSRCDFRETDLSGMDLRGRDFTHSLFNKSQCEGTRFDGSDFRGAKVSFMKAKNANFDNCNFGNTHFGYTDLTGASLVAVRARGTMFQHTKLSGADIRGADFSGGRMDADSVLQGIIADNETNFDRLNILRPTSRDPLFANYIFDKGVLRKGKTNANPTDLSESNGEANEMPPPIAKQSSTASIQIQHLLKNALVTRGTAQHFAEQIENILSDVPATNGNKLAEPLQTMLEFAEVLRNLEPEVGSEKSDLNRADLELRIAQLEALVERLTLQLSDEKQAHEATEALLKSDSAATRFKNSFATSSGIAAASCIGVGVPTAAAYFLGLEHPLVQAFLTVTGRLK